MRRASCRALLALLGAFGLLGGFGDRPAGAVSSAAEIRVSAAASLTDVLQPLGEAYRRETGVRVGFSFGASNTLARQIVAGAPCDVFLSADARQMDSLESRGLLAPGTRHVLLSNTLAVLVSAEVTTPVHGPADLARPALRSIALAEPSTVPAGIYAKQYLQRAGVWPRVEAKIVPTDNVRAALLAVEQGNADAAIVYGSDARVAHSARVAYRVPARVGPRIVYPVAVLRGAVSPRAARRFVAFLARPSSRAAFEKAGFVWAEPR